MRQHKLWLCTLLVLLLAALGAFGAAARKPPRRIRPPRTRTAL